MIRISSASTIILALFIPVFWLVFFGSLSLGLLITAPDDLPFSFNGLLKWIILGFFLIFSTVIYFTLFKLKRVDADHEFVYVSNYFKTVRIPIDQISELTCKSLSFRQLAKMQLNFKGIFGSKIYFITDSEKYNLLLSKISK